MSTKSYSLKFTPKASEDLEQIYSYISEDLFADAAAHNLLEKIERNIMKLRYFPYSGSFVLDELLRNKGYRKLVVDNYIVFYLVNELERQVVIMRILYGAVNYQNML
ncbi:type II toxin-antitoxin system mRNA interferase toxin, RelE/StbE family [Desulfosporosinus sp. BG]|uniref:type II toxin-antitoxin system RelE/ParE family toxin n=1 Tax=Desulfosporosinus sp. BG TaxID=1633135 RepID=UPI00083B2DEC|nr:type II toxin-antitoxin system mRNA interferase toxin, RelE/StbE family [Desulfosporosinus sp. BG]